MKNEVTIPISRFRRELKKCMRFINKNPDNVIFITKNKINVGVVLSPERYESMRKTIRDANVR